MSVSVTINGTAYDYPTSGDEDSWGPAAANWAVAVSAGLLQKSAGTFTLTAEVDFGTGFGLKSLYYRSRTTNVSSAGQVRLGNTDYIGWRNAANTADLTIQADASDILQISPAVTVTGALITSAALSTTLATDSTSITTGALKVTGGAGIGKSIVAGVASSIHKFAGTLKLISDDQSLAALYLPRYSAGTKFAYVVAGNASGTPVECGFVLQIYNSGLSVLEPFMITSAGAITLGASGGTQTHTINGTINLTVGATLPTAGGTAAALTAYETVTTLTSTYQMNDNAAASGSIVHPITMLGDIVSITIPSVTATSSGAAVTLVSQTALPARFRPTTHIRYFWAPGINGGASLAPPVMVFINTSGIISITRDGTAAAVWAAGSSGTNAPISVTYKI